MHFRLENLDHSLAISLEHCLVELGHSPADVGGLADALAIGTGVPRHAMALIDTPEDDWNAMIHSVRQVFVSVRDHAALLVAEQAAGRVVVVVDPPTVRAMESTGLAAAAGAFLSTMAHVAAAELGAHGIAVNVLVAGWTAPEPVSLGVGTPMGRLARAEEIASACAFLLDPERASFVTGATLASDGGWGVTKGSGENPFGSSTDRVVRVSS